MESKENFIKTYTGRIVCPYALDPSDIDIRDIAHALSQQCRFSGHTDLPYGVAEHSCRVHDLVPVEDRPWAILHDAPETYLLDLPRPVKRAPGYKLGEEFRAIEVAIMEVICDRFDLDTVEPESVEIADRRLLVTEQRDLMGHEPLAGNTAEQEEFEAAEPLEEEIWPWPYEMAEEEFLKRFEAAFGVTVPRYIKRRSRRVVMGGTF